MPVLANLKSIRLIVAFQIFNQWRLFWHTYVLNKELRLVKVKLITTVILSSQLCNKIAKEVKILYYTQISGVSFSQKNETFLFLSAWLTLKTFVESDRGPGLGDVITLHLHFCTLHAVGISMKTVQVAESIQAVRWRMSSTVYEGSQG